MDAEGECQLLVVPVRESGLGTLALRTGRLPSGQRVGLAFTSEASLLSVLGPGQPWIRLHENAMRDMLVPIGVDHIRVDARLSAAPGASAATEPQRVPASATPCPQQRQGRGTRYRWGAGLCSGTPVRYQPAPPPGPGRAGPPPPAPSRHRRAQTRT